MQTPRRVSRPPSRPLSSLSLKVLVTQLCPTLCDPKDCSLPGSSVHGILQLKNAGVYSILSKTNSETKTWAQLAYLGVDLKKHKLGDIKGTQRKEKSH